MAALNLRSIAPALRMAARGVAAVSAAARPAAAAVSRLSVAAPVPSARSASNAPGSKGKVVLLYR